MVIVRLEGGLGNQLFQYAAGRRLAHKLNTELKLDLTDAKISLNPKGHAYYRLGDFNITENFATPEEIAQLKNIHFVDETKTSVTEILNCSDNVYLKGYWQEENYFADISDLIRQEFTLKQPLGTTAQRWQKKILDAECSIALHIRHGDYLNLVHFGLVPLIYYKTCVAELKKFFPNVTAFVFSDDLNWTRKNLKLDVPTEFVADCESDNEEFYLMSLCKHIAIANSTFSWWAAWLNKNPDKKVFAPDPWFKDGHWKHDLPTGWIKVPVDYDMLFDASRPLLSIIAYVKNNAANLRLMLSGIFNQTFRDYELILIDDGSTDGSEHICRQVSLNKKVTLIAVGGDINW